MTHFPSLFTFAVFTSTPNSEPFLKALIRQLCAQIPENTVSGVINESNNKIWRILEKYADMAREQEDFSDVIAIGMDKTSRAKVHQHVTLFGNLKEQQTTFAA